MGKVKSEDKRKALAAVLWEIKQAWAAPIPINQCHRWVQDARDRLVALPRKLWDNEEYKIYWVDWTVDDPTYDDHGGLMIEFADGSVVYLDNGYLGGKDHVAFPEDVANHPKIMAEFKGDLIGVERPRIGLFTGWRFKDTPLGKLWRSFDEFFRALGELDNTICP